MAAEHTELNLTAADGTALFAQRWTPCNTPSRAELLVVPGYAEHSSRYRELAHVLVGMGVTVTAVDLRGHGRSSGRRGHIRDFGDYLADVDAAWAGSIGTTRFLLGHSLGGLVALDWVAQRTTSLRGLVVTNPFLELAIPVPPAKLQLAKLMARVWPTLALPNDLDPAALSHDADVVEAYRRDPLVFRTATAGWFAQTRTAQARVRAGRACRTSLLFVYSDADRVTLPSANASIATQLECTDKTVWLREGEYHEVLNETDRQSLHRDIGAWLVAHLAS